MNYRTKKNYLAGGGQTVASVQMIQQRTKAQGTHALNSTCGREQDTGEVNQGGTDNHSGGRGQRQEVKGNRRRGLQNATGSTEDKLQSRGPGSRQAVVGNMRSPQVNGFRNNQCADRKLNISLMYQLRFQFFDVLWTPHVVCVPAIKCPSFHMISSSVASRCLCVLHTLSFTAHAQCLNASVHADRL